MPLNLAQHVLEALILHPDMEVIDLESDLINRGTFKNIIYSEDGRKALLDIACAVTQSSSNFEIFDCVRGSAEWRFSEIKIGTKTIAEVLIIPNQFSDTAPPPSNAEVLLVRAWCATPDIIDPSSGDIKACLAIIRWVESEINATQRERLRVSCASLLAYAESKAALPYTATWNECTQLIFEIESRILDSNKTKKNSELLNIAINEVTIRWKYLGYYRVLEYGYLSAILDTINNGFLSSPGKSLEEAMQATKSEFNQFHELSVNNNLHSYFEDLSDKLDSFAASYNQFACALVRQCKSDSRLRDKASKGARGVLIAYQVRCAIVHAGEKSLIYESFDDAEEVLAGLIRHLEEAVLRYLGIIAI